MGRLIVSNDGFTVQKRDHFSEQQFANQYLNRVVKYIPVEAIACYSLLLGVISPATGAAYEWLSLLVFVACAVGNPIWLCRFARPGDRVMTHISVSFFAFIIWAYALGGENGWFGPHAMNIYDNVIASFALSIFTFTSGLIVPKSDSK
jgi:hypothetical protein